MLSDLGNLFIRYVKRILKIMDKNAVDVAVQ